MESTGQRLLRTIFYSVWAVVMTALTYVLGAAPLKVLRVRLGRLGYWVLGTGISIAFIVTKNPIMGLAFFSLVLLIGVFDEMEEAGFSFMASGFFTLLINSLLAAGAFALWVSHMGPKWSGVILSSIETLVKPLVEINPRFEINPYDLMVQLPSVTILLWMAGLYLAVLLENRLLGGEPVQLKGRVSMRSQLAEFRLPDPVVWLFIASLLGAFGGFHVRGLETVAINVMNVCLMLLFFQGIAVVARAFTALRMGAFWQGLFMLLIVLHLFLFVALLGLTDYWLDFRMRMNKNKKPIETNRV
jgi:hypothetical protein